MRLRLAFQVYRLAVAIAPELVLAIRNAVLAQLVDEQQKAAATAAAELQQHRQNVARIAASQ